MRYPYERFIRFLVSRKVNVPRALDRIGLPPVGELWVHETTLQLRRAAPRGFLHYFDSGHERPAFRQGFLDWAEQKEIRIFWENEPVFRRGPADATLSFAERLFSHRAMRWALGMLLMSPVRADDILKAMHDRFTLEIPAPVLPLYESVFWDFRNTTPAFWEDVLPQFALDERQAYALGRRWPPLGIHELRQFLDLEVRLDPEAVRREILAIARKGYQDELARPTPDQRVVLQWVARAQNVAEKLVKDSRLEPKTGEAAEDPKQRFNLFKVRPEETRMPTVAELPGEVSERDENGRQK